MDISILYMFAPTANTNNLPYNPNAPKQNWVRPLLPGERPTDFWSFQYVVDNGKVVTIETYYIQKGQAAVLNMPPAGLAQIPNGVFDNPNQPTPIPTPLDMSKLPTGTQIISAGPMVDFNMLPQIVPISEPLPVPSGTSDVEALILANVRLLVKAAGLTPQ